MTSDQVLRLERRAEQLGVTIVYDTNNELAEGDLGGWFPMSRRILVRPGLGHRNILHTVAHELSHVELGHEPNPPPWLDARQEREANEHAAMLLIDPDDYRAAEATYGSHPGAIAVELDTTVEMVEIWRGLQERIGSR